MSRDDLAFDVFEAVCGALGDLPSGGACCGAQAPMYARHVGLRWHPDGNVPYTRLPDHTGDHVAAHGDGWELARWAVEP
jgi:hypothetical protein